MFEDLLVLRGQGGPFDQPPRILNVAELGALSSAYPNLPNGYRAYLSTIGWGALGGSTLMIYSGPVEPSDVYGQTSSALTDVLLIGDDFNGNCFGITASDQSIVLVEQNGQPSPCATSFEAFIRSSIAEVMRRG